MRSDEEIERLLEDWLTDEAQPMSHDVLENALESVTRTTQTGARRGSPGWLRGPVGVLAAAALLILVVVAGGLTVDRIGSLIPTESSSAGPARVWDPVADFRRGANQMNPSPDSYGNPGVWSYFSSTVAHSPPSYRLLPAFTNDQWNDPAFRFLTVYLDRGGLLLHPWETGDSVRYTILGWKSPIAGNVTIRGTAALADTACTQVGSGITLSVDRGTQSLFVSEIPSGGTDEIHVSATMERGESIYFIVDPGADSDCDSTVLILEITHR